MKQFAKLVWATAIFAILVASGWYFVSPLLLNRTVDEALPFELPLPVPPAQPTTPEATPQFPDDDEVGVILPPTATVTSAVTGTVAVTVTEIVTATATDTSPVTTTETGTAEIVTATATVTTTEVTTASAANPVVASDAPATTPTVLTQGSFIDGDSFHKGSGLATLYQTPDDSYLLRFDDFVATNGPDLHVLLSPNAAPVDHASLGEYLDLGALKGNIGAQNYALPAEFDPTQYKSVVIYCLPFQIIFATATLEAQ